MSGLEIERENVEDFSLSAQVVHTSVKQVILRRELNKNGFEMYRQQKRHEQTVQNYWFLLLHIQICNFLVAVVVLAA